MDTYKSKKVDEVNKPNFITSYNFQYIEQQPSTLTMTTSPKQIFKALYKIPVCFWIDEKAQQSPERETIQSSISCLLLSFQNVEAAKKELKEKEYSNVSIISSLSLASEVQICFGKDERVLRIFCYSLEIDKFWKLREEKILGDKFSKGTNNLKQLTKYLSENQAEGFTENILMNFIPINKNAGKLNTTIKSLYSMLHQRTNRSQLINEVITLAKYMGFSNQKDFEQFREVVLGEQDLVSIVKCYTKQNFIHVIINLLLRSMTHPSEIYCIQPFFKTIFQAIRTLYKTRNQESFTCYRGGLINEQQLQFYRNKSNPGLILQNLSFLSTSKSQKVAEAFTSNVLFIITVPEHNEQCFGFADVSSLSNNPDEQEVLFNPLNFYQFKHGSKRVINGKQVDVIELLFKPNDQKLLGLKNYQKEMVEFKNIGDVLVQKREILKGCEDYWTKHKELSIKQEDININLTKKGLISLNKGEYKEALKCFQEREQKIFSNDQDRAQCYQSLGLVYDNLGQYNNSLSFYNKCEQIRMKIFGTNHPLYAETLNNIAIVYKNKGELQKSLQLYTKCEKIRKQVLGEDHPLYASTINNIGNVYSQLGLYKKSLQCFLKTQDIQRKTLGVQHSLYAAAINNIAVTYCSLGQYKKSIEFHKKCQQIRKKILGVQHPLYAQTLYNFGFVYSLLGMYQLSLQFYIQSSQIRRKTLGIQHPVYADTLNNIGILYDNIGQYQKSLEFYTKCEQIRRKALGVQHPSYAQTLNNVGLIYMKMGQYMKSLQFHLKAEAIAQKKYGVNHPLYKNIGNRIVFLCQQLNDFQAANFYQQKLNGKK